jgi:hypothetical protein
MPMMMWVQCCCGFNDADDAGAMIRFDAADDSTMM